MNMRFWILLIVTLLSGIWGWGQTSTTSIVDVRLSPGRLALEDGFAAEAEAEFRACLLEGELSAADTVAAREYLLQALLDQGKCDEMLVQLDTFAAEQGLTEDAAAYWRATSLYGQEQYGACAALLSPFGETWPGSRWKAATLRLLGLSRLKSGDVQGAIDAFAMFATEYPESPEQAINHLDWGKALIFHGSLGEALTVLAPVMTDAAGGHPAYEARYWVGKAHLQLGDVETGRAVLTPLVTNPEVAEGIRVKAVLVVADGLSASGDTDGAVQLLGDTLAASPGEAHQRDLSQALCSALLKGGRLDEAIPLVRAYVSSNAEAAASASLQLQLGEVLLDAERHDEAILVYQQYLETFAREGGQAHARMGHGWALVGVGRYAEAAVAFEKAHDLFTVPEQRTESLLKVADARFLNAQFQHAQELYERFLEEFPGSLHGAEAKFQLAACLEALGKHEETERAFERVVEEHPDSPEATEALLRIGELHHALKEWKAAEAAFDRVMQRVESGPLFAAALHGRGLARYQLWSPDALADFERIGVEYSSDDVAAHALFMQAMCLYRLGRDAQALAVCHRFLEQYPESTWAPSVRFWIGRFSYNTGDYVAAEAEFLSFVEQYAKHALADRAVYRAGLAAVKRKEYVRAIELFGRLAKQYPESEWLAGARFHQADAMCELGKFAGAILVFEEVINNYPASELVPLAWGRKGDCLFTLGAEDPARYEEAIRSYRVVAQSPQARRDHIWQAAYKIGRTLEKLEREDEAQGHFYTKVMVPFLVAKAEGETISESAKTWFTRAALGAADIATARGDWRKLVRILDRISEAEVAISGEARARIKTIKSEHWWLFY
ncbi:MAG: tetratricopeptide repeat protein [Verrucomicrobia bacterium]|nr:tetratricopeptide repeat protein [Verrucomicrobiota bacterium]